MRNLNLVVAGVLFLSLQWGLDGLPDRAGAGLALLATIAWLWLTEALHVSVTALLVPVLAAASGVLAFPEALLQFADPVVFLFLGGFALAAGLQRQGLDRWMAGQVLRRAGASFGRAVRWLFWLTAFLSMWISNTATAAMMLPLALGLLRGDDEPDDGTTAQPGSTAAAGGTGDAIGARERIFVLLVLAYSCSIGGIATPVGSPPNAIAAAQAGIGFAQWLGFGLPAVALLWPLMLGLLGLLLRPRLGGRVELAPVRIEWTRPRMLTVAIFGATVAAWIGGAPLARALGIAGDTDGIVALAAIALLVGSGALGWPELERRAQWGVLLLFGGGLALSALMQASGASRFLAEGVIGLVQGAPAWLVLAGVVAFVVFLTELVSNTASAALLLPIFLPMAELLGLPAPAAAATIAIAASCAFMLPVATPPNAIVFGTDQVPQREMMRCGLWLNLACIGAITVLAGWLWA